MNSLTCGPGSGSMVVRAATNAAGSWFAITFRFAILLLAVWYLVGCMTPIPGASPNLLAFLNPGHTTRQEVVLKFGQPSGAFEQERILTYRLGEDPQQGYFLVTPKSLMPWSQVRHSLVLVFDAQGVLEKQSLVPVQ